MPVLRLFAAAREAAGVARADFEGTTVAELLAAAERSFGDRFSAVLKQSRVWVNGEPATADTPVAGHDVVAVLPPVSGGAGDLAPPPAPPAPPRPRPAPPRSWPTSLSRPAAPSPRPSPGRSDPLAKPMPVAGGRQPAPGGSGPAPKDGLGGGGTARDPGLRGGGPSSRTGGQDRGQGPPGSLGAVPASARAVAVEDPRGGGGPGATSSRSVTPPRERGSAPPVTGRPSSSPRRADPGSGPAPRPERPSQRRPGPERPSQRRPGPERGPGGANRRKPIPSATATTSAAAKPPVPAPESDEWWAPLARLGVIYDNARPHGRIGFVWAVITVTAVIAGPEWTAGWLGVNAFVGASQAAGTRRSLDVAPPPWLAAVAALAPPVAAIFGGRYVVAVAGAGLAAALLVRTFVNHRQSAHAVSLALLMGMAIGLSAASLALTRELDVKAAVYLLACACIYDAGAYLIGTGAHSAWEGPLAGVVALIPVTILAAVVLVPPYPPGTPLALGLLAAVLAPLGPLAGTWLLGRRDADAPGLRRLDSLILLGPAWAWLTSTILH